MKLNRFVRNLMTTFFILKVNIEESGYWLAFIIIRCKQTKIPYCLFFGLKLEKDFKVLLVFNNFFPMLRLN